MQKPNTDWGFPWSVFFVIMMRIFDYAPYYQNGTCRADQPVYRIRYLKVFV